MTDLLARLRTRYGPAVIATWETTHDRATDGTPVYTPAEVALLARHAGDEATLWAVHAVKRALGGRLVATALALLLAAVPPAWADDVEQENHAAQHAEAGDGDVWQPFEWPVELEFVDAQMGTIGVLYLERPLRFEGDADASALVFFRHIGAHLDATIEEEVAWRTGAMCKALEAKR